MSWTDERIATLKKMWEGGATASQIADELTGVSRNAVIGKAHRLGLKARPSPVKPNDEKPEPKKAAPAPAPAAAKPAIKRPAASPVHTPAARAPEPESRPAPSAETPSQPIPNLTPMPRIVSVGPGGFLRQGPGDQQPPIPPAPR
jgi:GcrA cell cycle regulator